MPHGLILLDNVDWGRIKWLPFTLPSFDYARIGKEILSVLLGLLVLRLLLGLVVNLIRLYHDLRGPGVLLELTPPRLTEVSAETTAELFNLVLGLLRQRGLADRLLLKQPSYSFEIVSTKEAGIRYLVRVPKAAASVLEKTLRSYVPGIRIRETEDYLPRSLARDRKARVVEFRLDRHFAYPLDTQPDLGRHDPLAYLAGGMTQLHEGEVAALQVVLKPLAGLSKRAEIGRIVRLSSYDRFPDWLRSTDRSPAGSFLASAMEGLLNLGVVLPATLLSEALSPSRSPRERSFQPKPQRVPTPAERQTEELVLSKIREPLFEGAVRTLLLVGPEQVSSREKGLRSSFESFRHTAGQSLRPARGALPVFRRWKYANRLSGPVSVLSNMEVAALWHFPHSRTTETEDLGRVRSRELPAPLSLKNTKALDVVFGRNRYASGLTAVGLTDEDRSRHVYLLGQTGSGKSTVIYHMAKDDIKRGRGLAVVDPHGDLAEDLLSTVPLERTDDLVYLNPFDTRYPVGINLLEIREGLSGDELELEQELVCESVISVFRRIFNKDEHTDAHRIEYILRNAIYTAFTVEGATIFTVYNLLNDSAFRKSIVKKLTDENLALFWKREFGRAGAYQEVKMAGGVTAKIGRFLFSPVARKILEQPRSTIDFDEILDRQKILLCNLAEGKIGEDTSQLLGTMVIAKLHQAVVRRARSERSSRTSFYLFVDEFQNFATGSFTKLLSGGRKFGLRVTIAEQSTAQQADRNVTDVILANTGTVICFRTASPLDEELMLSQFAPSIEKGDIGNLPRYRFYMRLSAVEPTAAFSGETLPVPEARDERRVRELVEASRRNYAANKEVPKQMEKPKRKLSAASNDLSSAQEDIATAGIDLGRKRSVG